MTQEEVHKKIKYWLTVPRALWDKDEIIDISFALNRLVGKEINDMDQFIAELIEQHNIVLTENQKLFVQNARMKHTIKQLTTRNN